MATRIPHYIENTSYYHERLLRLPWQVLSGSTSRNTQHLIFKPTKHIQHDVINELKLIIEAKTGLLVKSIKCKLYRNGLDHDLEYRNPSNCHCLTLSFGDTRLFYLKHEKTGRRSDYLLVNGDLLYTPASVNIDHRSCVPRITSTETVTHISVSFFASSVLN